MTKKASRLFNNFRPENYALELDIDPDKMTFKGRVVISGAKTGPPSSRITLHQKDLKITSAKLYKHDKKTGVLEINISRLNLHKSFDELRIHTTEKLFPGEYTVEVAFSGRITEPMHGIYPCYFDKQRKKLIATQLESHHAREVFPCIDEPEAKATFDLTLVTPKATVISNTPIKKQKTINNKQKTKSIEQKAINRNSKFEIRNSKIVTVFERTPRMSSYLLAFAFGDLAYKEARTKTGTAVRAYATPDKKHLLDFVLKTAVRCIDFFEDYFQTPYPLAKLDVVGLPDFSSGAMENWGLITFRESIFLVDPKSTSIETTQLTALVLAHELSHMWFGNLVTMRWWDDLWLNESFANLMEYIAVEALFPQWHIFEHFISGEMGAAFQRDSLPGVQAVRTKVRHPDELGTLFDPAIVYAKGGSLLHMVRNLVGDEAFRRGLKAYFQKHSYGNTEASNLWQAIGQAADINIEAFIDNWLNRPGFPVVEINHQPGTKHFQATQKRLIAGRGKAADTIWQVPLATSSNENILLKAKSAKFRLSQVSSPLVFNNDGQSYYLPRYLNQQHQADLVATIAKGLSSPINRLQLIGGYSLMEMALLVTNAENLALLTAYKNETEESVWSTISRVIGDAKKLVIGQQSHEANLNGYTAFLVSGLIKRLGWDAKKGENTQTHRLRNLALSLGASSEMPEVLTEGKKRFTSFKKPADLAPDIRDVVYYIAARFGLKTDVDKLLATYKQLENADERNEIAVALTATRDKAQLSRLIAMLTTKDVRRQDTVMWFGWLLGNHYGRAAAWDWLVNNWVWVEKYFASDKTYVSFVKYAAAIFSKPQELENFQQFFTPKLSELSLERAIRLGIEEIESRVAWRKLNEASTKRWLAARAKS